MRNLYIYINSTESWETLLKAAQLRKYSPILEIAETLSAGESPVLTYHRQCRSVFTHKRDLDKIKRKSTEMDPESEVDAGTSEVRKTAAKRQIRSERVYKISCIFCKKTKFKKKTKTREALVQARQLRADENLCQLAVYRQDQDIIAVTSRDIVAA